jgi:hypothetical protein
MSSRNTIKRVVVLDLDQEYAVPLPTDGMSVIMLGKEIAYAVEAWREAKAAATTRETR